MSFIWNSNINTSNETNNEMPNIIFDNDNQYLTDSQLIENNINSCNSYYGAYNPLCPSPTSENRKKMIDFKFDNFVYLDNNATHPINDEVKTIMIDMMNLIGNASSPHIAGIKVRAYIEDARIKIANAIGLSNESDASKIIFTSSGTESINTFIKGVFFKNIKSERNIIITTEYEHKATLNSIQWLVDNFNIKVHYIKINDDGTYKINENFIKENSNKILLVSVMSANNELGIISDYQELCNFIKNIDSNIKFHVDMSQSIGKMKHISVLPTNAFTSLSDKNFIDAATFTSHKFGGPVGVSVLYIRDFNIFESLLHGGNQEFQKRAGTYNAIQIVGMAKAIELIKDSDIDNIKNLRDYLDAELINNFNCTINFNKAKRIVNTTSVTFKYDMTSDEIIDYLSQKGFFVSSASACNSREKNASYVLKSMGISDYYAYRTVRISLNKYTTKKNIDDFIDQLKLLLKLKIENL